MDKRVHLLFFIVNLDSLCFDKRKGNATCSRDFLRLAYELDLEPGSPNLAGWEINGLVLCICPSFFGDLVKAGL